MNHGRARFRRLGCGGPTASPRDTPTGPARADRRLRRARGARVAAGFDALGSLASGERLARPRHLGHPHGYRVDRLFQRRGTTGCRPVPGQGLPGTRALRRPEPRRSAASDAEPRRVPQQGDRRSRRCARPAASGPDADPCRGPARSGGRQLARRRACERRIRSRPRAGRWPGRARLSLEPRRPTLALPRTARRRGRRAPGEPGLSGDLARPGRSTRRTGRGSTASSCWRWTGSCRAAASPSP